MKSSNKSLGRGSLCRPSTVIALAISLLVTFQYRHFKEQGQYLFVSDYGTVMNKTVSIQTAPLASLKNNERDGPFKHYPCFTDRYEHDAAAAERFHPVNSSNIVHVYLQTIWYTMHSETFYTFIHQFCSCEETKDRHWMLPPHSIPHFYIGPHELPDLEPIFEELNKTNCGPIFLGTPPSSSPFINVITTVYAGHIPSRWSFDMLNDNKTIFIFHNSDNSLEGANASNVFWLTPRHSRYVVPKYFPPTIVEQTKKDLIERPNPQPTFLVMGSFTDGRKRNVRSIAKAMQIHLNRTFTIRFLGGAAAHTSSNDLHEYVNKTFETSSDKIELLPNLDNYEFMKAVGSTDVILPLVDETNFYCGGKCYQNGSKLSSTVSWALGFEKNMVIYKPLAELFGIPDDGVRYWHYDNSTVFPQAFEKCLDALERSRVGNRS